MKTFKQFSEGMGRTIASFQSRKGDIEIERERDPKYSKKYKYYAQVDNKWDFCAKDAKELRKKLKDLGANPDDPSYGEIPKK